MDVCLTHDYENVTMMCRVKRVNKSADVTAKQLPKGIFEV
jgi:hypothetical protein